MQVRCARVPANPLSSLASLSSHVPRSPRAAGRRGGTLLEERTVKFTATVGRAIVNLSPSRRLIGSAAAAPDAGEPSSLATASLSNLSEQMPLEWQAVADAGILLRPVCGSSRAPRRGCGRSPCRAGYRAFAAPAVHKTRLLPTLRALYRPPLPAGALTSPRAQTSNSIRSGPDLIMTLIFAFPCQEPRAFVLDAVIDGGELRTSLPRMPNGVLELHAGIVHLAPSGTAPPLSGGWSTMMTTTTTTTTTRHPRRRIYRVKRAGSSLLPPRSTAVPSAALVTPATVPTRQTRLRLRAPS